ncbi:hypothetical protein MKW92_043967, partial [Papaver armeniacum]
MFSGSVLERFVLVFALFICCSEGLNEEGKYLLKLKSLVVDGHNHLNNWNPSDSTPCQWNGVNCSYDSFVSSLILRSMNLSGTLSTSASDGIVIGGLAHLTELDLSYNKFSGKIPEDIGNCSMLEVLNLNNNQFEGDIPVELGKLSRLTKLNMCNNRLSGSLPSELGDLSSLEELILFTNKLTGSLPSLRKPQELDNIQSRSKHYNWKHTSRIKFLSEPQSVGSRTKSV